MNEVINAWVEGLGAKQIFFVYGGQLYQVEKAKKIEGLRK